MTQFDKYNNYFAREQLHYSVNEALNAKKELDSLHQKRQFGEVSKNHLLDVWKTLLSLSKYFLSNTFGQNIEYCSVAFSGLFSLS